MVRRDARPADASSFCRRAGPGSGPIFGPGPSSDVSINTLNYTDFDTLGFRAELTKILGNDNLLTYGAEYFEDDSFNTDHSVTTTTLRAVFPLSFICGPAGASWSSPITRWRTASSSTRSGRPRAHAPARRASRSASVAGARASAC